MFYMKILSTKSLTVPALKTIRFARFCDHRGYFTEHYRKSDFQHLPELDFMHHIEFGQCNESFSHQGTIRGLHFQWNPYMGKLVRPITGHLIDIALDIRKGSPTLGKIILYDMPVDRQADSQEWLWVPPGFAHGLLCPQDSLVEYFCSGQYNPDCEAGISPLADDLDWSLCDPNLKDTFDQIASKNPLISPKDEKGLTINNWLNDPRSDHFLY